MREGRPSLGLGTRLMLCLACGLCAVGDHAGRATESPAGAPNMAGETRHIGLGARPGTAPRTVSREVAQVGATGPARKKKKKAEAEPAPVPAADLQDAPFGMLTGTKDEVPPETDIARAEQAAREVHGSELQKAKSPSAKVVLASKMIEQAQQTRNDAAGVYALLKLARELASEGGDAKVAAEAVDALCAAFTVDAITEKLQMIEPLTRSVRGPIQQRDLCEVALDCLGDALHEAHLDAAQEFGKVALASGRSANDGNLLKRITARSKELEEIMAEFGDVPLAQRKLESEPRDPEANLLVGRYLCFIGNDWDKGLPCLVKSGDAKLSQLARQELDAQEPDQVTAAADQWWDLAQSEKTGIKAGLTAHALELYQRVLPDLSGLSRARIEKRIEAAEKENTYKAPQSGYKPGLVAEYFEGIDFRNRVGVRIDPLINFSWGVGSPSPSLPPDNFSVRWHGYLKAPRPGKYKLIVDSNDGVRVTLDGKVIIDDLRTVVLKRTAEVELDKQPHALRIDYFEGPFTAWCRLRWSYAGSQEQVIAPQFLAHRREQEKINTSGRK